MMRKTAIWRGRHSSDNGSPFFGAALSRYPDASARAQLRLDVAYERLIAATAELNTMPTTLAGIAALLRAMAKTYDYEGDENGDVWGSTLYDHDDRDENGDLAGDPIINNAGLLMEILENLAGMVESIHA